VKNALACISAVDDLHRKERQGVYTGGERRRLERRADRRCRDPLDEESCEERDVW
jgi:hypothetical protein